MMHFNAKKIAFAAAVLALSAGPLQAKSLRYATSQSSTNSAYTEGFEPFAKRVAEDTDGDLKLRLFPGGQLASAKGTLAAISDGTADAGMVIPIFVPSELRAINAIAQILFAGSNPVAVAGATAETILLNCPACQEEMAAHDAMSLAPYATSAYYLQCANEVSGFDSLKGRRMRIGGGVQHELLSEMQATQVVVTAPDTVEALTRGQLDCAVAPLPWLQTYSLQDGVNYVVDYPVGIFRGLDTLSFRKSSWDALSKQQRAAVLKNVPRLFADTVIHGYIEEEAKVRKEALAHGIKFVEADDAFEQAVAAVRSRERELVTADAKKRGVSNFDEIWKKHQQALAKWEPLSKEIGNDPEKFAKALWEQVYSKIPN